MKTDILFLAKNRLAFTRESLCALQENTNWSLVGTLWLVDDGSEDGALDRIDDTNFPVDIRYERTKLGSPADAINVFSRIFDRELFAKIDNDVIVPPGWLDACMKVMEQNPKLDLLGIEPPLSRTPSKPDGYVMPAPEYNIDLLCNGYARCLAIGGVGLMRCRAFTDNAPLRPFSTYSGFTEWQLGNTQVSKGWIVPSIKMFLLDRLPLQPWRSLSNDYISKGWQRPWTSYALSSIDLWEWWKPRFSVKMPTKPPQDPDFGRNKTAGVAADHKRVVR